MRSASDCLLPLQQRGRLGTLRPATSYLKDRNIIRGWLTRSILKESGIWGSGTPASMPFLPVWRQLFLPVHLLGLAPLLGRVGPVAGDVKLQDDGMMDHPVDGRGGGHGVGEDALPLGEDQV